MAQNISLLGANYSDVPAVELPKTGGGTARFDDASVTTAIESDVTQGKIFLKADGSIGTGTASGGGSNTLFGLPYNTGTFTVEEDTKGSSIEIYHGLGVIPGTFFAWCADYETVGLSTYTEMGCMYIKNSFQNKILRCAHSTGKTLVTGTSNVTSANVTDEKVILPVTASSAYYRPGYTYRWLAIA